MSETPRVLGASIDSSKVGPDFFSYYTHEVKELLLQDDDFLPPATEFAGNRLAELGKDKIEHSHGSSTSFFRNSVGSGLSDCKNERLKALLRQTVFTLTPEVDEMLDPVVAMQRLQLQVRSKKSIADIKDAASDGDTGQPPNKKLRILPSTSSASITALASPMRSESFRKGSAAKCMQSKNLDVSPVKPSEEKGDDDLKFLLENDISLVEEIMKKYSNELFTSLDHMEKQLEELLDTVASTCRPMTLIEKMQLQKLIKKLPPKNFNRIVEIVQRSETADTDEVFVDLEQLDNITLWRLYYYVEAVEKARNLAQS